MILSEQKSAKTFAQPDRSRVVHSLACQVRHIIGVSEGPYEALMCADFDDQLRAAADDPARIALCEAWLQQLRALREALYD